MGEHVVWETLGEITETFLIFVETSEPANEALSWCTEAGYEVRILVTADRNGEIGQGPVCLIELAVDDDSQEFHTEDRPDLRAVVEEFLSHLETERRQFE